MARDFKSDIKVPFFLLVEAKVVIAGMQTTGCSHFLGNIQATWAEIGTDNFAGAQRLQCRHQQAANWANAGDKHLFPCHFAGLLRRVYRHRQRFGKHHHLFITIGVKGNTLRAIDHLVLGEGTVNMRKVHRAAEETHLSTLVLLTCQTILALATGLARV
ncbi:hypothetical protein D3C80_1491660 [compost metagenome]